MNFTKRLIGIFLLGCAFLSAGAVGTDTLKVAFPQDTVGLHTVGAEADSLAADKQVKKNIWKKISDYFAKSNHYDRSKKIDFGIIGGPSFSSATGLGIGLVASGLYSFDKADTTLQLSNISLFGNVSTTGMLVVGVRGNNFLPKDRFHFDYSLYVLSLPSNFWGVGYEAGNNDENKTNYSRLKFEFKPKFLFHVFENMYVGPAINLQYVKASKMTEQALALLGGNPDLEFWAYGAGLSLTYDSRDIITNATRGHFLQLEQFFYPTQLGNEHRFYMTDLTYATYHKAWKGAVIAGEFHSMLNFKDVPWPLLAAVGSPNRMRGYYEGRYRDKSIVEMQIELRQHIWKRNGAVLWVGAANVFPEFRDMRLKKTLLNAGVGYRWAFKQGVNVRFDVGFSKNGLGFAFNINEAF